MSRIEFLVTLNGTSENPYARLGLIRNPFPALADAHLPPVVEDTLADLAAGPIHGHADLRRRLAGWSPEFIELCIASYKPGRITRFAVSFDDQGETSE